MSSPTLLAGQKPTTALAVQPFLGDQLLEHGLGVVEERARRLADICRP